MGERNRPSPGWDWPRGWCTPVVGYHRAPMGGWSAARRGARIEFAGRRPTTSCSQEVPAQLLPAELRLAGDRPAGIISATVAEHLAGAHVVLGHRPVIAGVSHWAESVAQKLRWADVHIRVIGQPGSAPPAWGDEWLGTGVPRAVRGHPRIELLEWSRLPGGALEQVSCDALVLAAPARPLRNVEGAVFGGEGVTFIAELDLAVGEADIVARAEAAAHAITVEPRRIHA